MTISCRKKNIRIAIAVMAMAMFFMSRHAGAACDFDLQGEGRVAEVLNGRGFRLDDGREVRLAGIEPSTYAQGADAEYLRSLIAGRDVTLHAANDSPDRYGRQQAFVFVYGSDAAIQNQLLSQGLAFANGDIPDRSCATELGASEKAARGSRRGLWSNPAAVKNAENRADILSQIGHFTVIEGKVISARQAGATFYINFGGRWIQDFAVTISRRMMPSFEAAGLKLTALDNKRIRVRGWVEQRGGPRIEASQPGQIEIIDGSGAATASQSE